MLKLSRLPSGEPEIFRSIQGEGVTAGLPSVFVRLALCNLTCDWCDTRYTWDWARFDPNREVVQIDVDRVASQVVGTGLGNAVITGGEPLLQQQPLVALAMALKSAGIRIEVETNGTISPDPGLAALVDQWNVSPKLATSGNMSKKRVVPPSLSWFAGEARAYFKFVVVALQDLDEIDELVSRYAVPKERVILMPEGADRPTMDERSGWLVQACCDRGYRFSTRLHILLWGDTRGR